MPPLSPRTQQMGAGDPSTSVEGAFEQGVTQQAYAQFESAHPELVDDVMALRVIRADPDEGTAVAVFALRRGDRQLYVPMVMSDSDVAPLDMVHDPDLNVFVPLTPEWLAFLDASRTSSMGEAVKPPDTLFTDVDIRNIVVPPLTGRYSYAALEAQADKVARTMLSPQRNTVVHLRTLDMLRQASVRTREQFLQHLRVRPKLAARFFEVFDVREADAALRSVPATDPPLTGGALCVLGVADKASRFQEVFGKDTPRYYSQARERGYAGKDGRRGVNRLITVQPYRIGGQPSGSDVYMVRRADGTTEPALVLRNPIDLFSGRRSLDRKPASAGHVPPADRVSLPGRPSDINVDDDPVERPRYLVILAGGKYFECSNLDVQPVPSHDRANAAESLLRESTATPSGEGLFVRRRSGRLEATLPMRVERVSTDTDKTRHVVVKPVDYMAVVREKTLSTPPGQAYGGIVAPPRSSVAHLPSDFTWVPLHGEGNRGSYVLDSHDGSTLVADLLERAGTRPGRASPAGAGQVSVNGGMGTTVREAAEFIARRYYAAFDDAVKVAEAARHGGTTTFYAVPPTVPTIKVSAEDVATSKPKGPPKKPAPQQPPGSEEEPPVDADAAEDVAAGEAGDPSMPPEEGMAPAPSPTSPADLATAEFGEELRRQMEQIQAHMGLLEAVRNRAQQIAGGAAPSPSTMTAMQGLPPLSAPQSGAPGTSPMQSMPQPQMPGMQQPMQGDPGMMGGQPPMPAGPGMGPPVGGQQQAMPQLTPDMLMALQGMLGMGGSGDSSMMSGAGGVGDPMGGAGGVGDPSMMGAPGVPPFDLGQQIDAGPAAAAGDAHMDQTFDAALMSSLSKAPDLQARVVEYLPDLRRAVDDTGRLLLTLRMKRHELSEQTGEQSMNRLLDSAQTSFESLGELVIALSQNSRLPNPGQVRG